MPSKLLAPLNSFENGLNTAINDRDIKDTEYTRGDNLDSSIQGRLRCIGKLDTFFDTATSGDTNLGGVDTVAGYGLYAFNVDRDTLNAEVDGSYIAMFESSTYGPIISVDDFVNSGTNTAGTYTNISLTGGDGSGAIGTVTVNSSGSISDVKITNPGNGYKINNELGISAVIGNQVLTVDEIVSFDDNIQNTYTNVPLTSVGGGTGAKATVVVFENGSGGEIVIITITDGGSGYTVNDELTIPEGYLGEGSGGGTCDVASISGLSAGGTVDVAVIANGIQLYVEPAIDGKYTLDDEIKLDAVSLGSGNGYARSSTKVDYLAVDGSLRVFNRNFHFSPQKWWYLETGGIYFNAIKTMANDTEDATILQYTSDSIKGYKQDNQFVIKPTGGTVYKSVVGDNGVPKLTSTNVISEGEVGLIINRHNQTGVDFVGWGESVGEEDRYEFHASFVYDGNQESMTKRIGAATLGGKTSGDEHNDISFTAVVRPCNINNSSTSNGIVSWNPRITSVRIYYRKVDENKDILYFIGDYPTKTSYSSDEIARIDRLTNFGLAYLKGDGTGKGIYAYDDWGVYHKQPPVIFTHAVKSGIRSNTVSVECGYKTAAILNRKLYVGNIKQRTEDSPNIEKQYPDRLLKSINNRFDVLPDTEFVDVAIRDGESIVKLVSFGNRLLQFKDNTLYVLAVAGGEEYLEATYKNMGVRHPNAVTVFEQGIFWVNEFGAYLFNGESAPINIINNKIAIPDWHSFITDDSVTGHYAREQKLFVIDSANLWNPSSTKIEMYIFNMLTQSWNVQKSVVGETGYNAVSNIINYKDVISHGGKPVGTNHTLFIVGKDVSGAKFLEYKSIDDLSAPYPLLPVTFITKELTANAPHQRKKIYGCYITYRGNMTQDNHITYTNNTCDYSDGSSYVDIDSTASLSVGMDIETPANGTSPVPGGTTIISIDSNGTRFRMSNNATVTINNRQTEFVSTVYVIPKVKMHFVSQGKTTDTITLEESESGLSFDDASDWETAKYLVSSADKTKASNVYSVKLEISPGTNSTAIDSSFEINDISLIFRMKSIK